MDQELFLLDPRMKDCFLLIRRSRTHFLIYGSNIIFA